MSFTFAYPITPCAKVIVCFEKRRKSSDCPTGIRFAVVGLIEDEEVIRIDNSPHQGRLGTHIHIGKRVRFKEFADYWETSTFVEERLKNNPRTWRGCDD